MSSSVEKLLLFFFAVFGRGLVFPWPWEVGYIRHGLNGWVLGATYGELASKEPLLISRMLVRGARLRHTRKLLIVTTEGTRCTNQRKEVREGGGVGRADFTSAAVSFRGVPLLVRCWGLTVFAATVVCPSMSKVRELSASQGQEGAKEGLDTCSNVRGWAVGATSRSLRKS